jgi:hypothetical protein
MQQIHNSIGGFGMFVHNLTLESRKMMNNSTVGVSGVKKVKHEVSKSTSRGPVGGKPGAVALPTTAPTGSSSAPPRETPGATNLKITKKRANPNPDKQISVRARNEPSAFPDPPGPFKKARTDTLVVTAEPTPAPLPAPVIESDSTSADPTSPVDSTPSSPVHRGGHLDPTNDTAQIAAIANRRVLKPVNRKSCGSPRGASQRPPARHAPLWAANTEGGATVGALMDDPSLPVPQKLAGAIDAADLLDSPRVGTCDLNLPSKVYITELLRGGLRLGFMITGRAYAARTFLTDPAQHQDIEGERIQCVLIAVFNGFLFQLPRTGVMVYQNRLNRCTAHGEPARSIPFVQEVLSAIERANERGDYGPVYFYSLRAARRRRRADETDEDVTDRFAQSLDTIRRWFATTRNDPATAHPERHPYQVVNAVHELTSDEAEHYVSFSDRLFD